MMIESYAIALWLALFVIMLAWSKKTDYAVGCTRFREIHCRNPYVGKCPFPDCPKSKSHTTKKIFVW